MMKRKASSKAVVGNFLSGVASSEIPKLAPLAQAGVQAGLGRAIPGIGGQIIGGALAPIVGEAVNLGAGIVSGIASLLHFKKGGIIMPMMMKAKKKKKATKRKMKK